MRWRLTALYGALFLLAGLMLLAVSYLIVRQNIDSEVGREREQILVDLIEAGADPEATGFIADFPLSDGRTVAEVMADSAVAVRSEALDELVVAYSVAIPVAVVLSLLLGWWAAGRALAPVTRLTGTARHLSEANLRPAHRPGGSTRRAEGAGRHPRCHAGPPGGGLPHPAPLLR